MNRATTTGGAYLAQGLVPWKLVAPK
jgi:hypothetical protein